jgi:antitoxin VapB
MADVTPEWPCSSQIRVYATSASINRLTSEDGMTLHIRDDKAAELARQLAQREGVSVDEAVVHALEAALARARRPLAERIGEIRAELHRVSNPEQGRPVTKQEIDELWGND